MVLHYRLLYFIRTLFTLCLSANYHFYCLKYVKLGWMWLWCMQPLLLKRTRIHIAQGTGKYWYSGVLMYSGIQSNYCADRCSVGCKEWAVEIKGNMGICCAYKDCFISKEVHVHGQHVSSFLNSPQTAFQKETRVALWLHNPLLYSSTHSILMRLHGREAAS